MERIANRAKLPLRYSRGFNPRPVLSLPCPRPVGVATLDDRLVFALDEPMDEAELRRRLNRQAPDGLRFLTAHLLQDSKTPQVRRVEYELPLAPDHVRELGQRLEELKTMTKQGRSSTKGKLIP